MIVFEQGSQVVCAGGEKLKNFSDYKILSDDRDKSNIILDLIDSIFWEKII